MSQLWEIKFIEKGKNSIFPMQIKGPKTAKRSQNCTPQSHSSGYLAVILGPQNPTPTSKLARAGNRLTRVSQLHYIPRGICVALRTRHMGALKFPGPSSWLVGARGHDSRVTCGPVQDALAQGILDKIYHWGSVVGS